MQPNYRRCVSCRRVAPKAEFWRVVRVYPDRRVTLADGMGRSAYLCPQPDCLRLAQKKNRLGRALKANIPAAVFEQLWLRLRENSAASTAMAVATSEELGQTSRAIAPSALGLDSPKP